MFQHRIEDRQQLAHAGGQGDFLCFAGGTQALIEGFDDAPFLYNRGEIKKDRWFGEMEFINRGGGSWKHRR